MSRISPGCRFASVDDHHDARGGGVVEEVLGQQQHRLDQVVIDERLADVTLFVGALVAAAPADRTGVEHDRHPARGLRGWRPCAAPSPSRRSMKAECLGRTARRGRSRRSRASNFWFHIGLAVTRSNGRSRPSPSVNAGRCMVSPSAISASMSWMKAFMRAIANVDGLISWPYSLSGATFGGSFDRPFCRSPCVSSSRRWHLMRSPPEPQHGS